MIDPMQMHSPHTFLLLKGSKGNGAKKMMNKTNSH